MRQLEKRFVKGMELRLDEPKDGTPKLSGYIALFNSLSPVYGEGSYRWREKIAPGAFAESITRDDIRGLWNHENDLVLGRLSAGTLRLTEDEKGLAFDNDPPDTSWFRDRAVSLRRKDVTGSSFGFFTDPNGDEWETDEEGVQVRTLKKLTLVEVSPGVTFPFYPDTSTEVALRSMNEWLEREKNRVPQDRADAVDMELRERRLRMQRLTL